MKLIPLNSRNSSRLYFLFFCICLLYFFNNNVTPIEPHVYADYLELIYLVPMLVYFFSLLNRNYQDRRMALNELRENISFYSTILNNLPNYIYTLDKNKRFTFVNKAYLRELDQSSEEAIGRLKSEVVYKVTKRNIKDALLEDERVLSSRSVLESGTSQLVKHEGEATWIDYKKIPIYDLNGNVTGMVCIMNNINEHLKNKEIIEETNKTLASKNDALERYIDSNLELENFAYIASHDLKSPLRSIAGFSQLLQRTLKDKLTAQENDYFEFIIDGCKNLKNLIEDLLAYSLLNSSKNKMKNSNISEIINDAVDSLSVVIKDENVEISTKTDPTIYANVDALKLKQLFFNLISNAIKYRSKERRPKIEISHEIVDGNHQFCIADNGIGIKEEFYEQIFILLKRLNKANSEGTGIGLSICKRIVEQHMGEIWVDSKENEGSKFYFTIPVNLRDKLQSIDEAFVNA